MMIKVQRSLKRRVGRGPSSGRGKTCGRGQKGQKARGSLRPGFEGGQMPLYRRVARRGFSNSVFSIKERGISLSVLDKWFSSGDEVTLMSLYDKGLIRRKDDGAKILATGKISASLTVRGVSCSQAAKKTIIAAGGRVEEGEDSNG